MEKLLTNLLMNIDTDSDDIYTCYEKCINNFTQMYDKCLLLTPSTVKKLKIRKLKGLG